MKPTRTPPSPAKFSVGLLFVGLGFAVPDRRLRPWPSDGTRVSPHVADLGVYMLHTIGELCLSPVGLSAMTKLAPTASWSA